MSTLEPFFYQDLNFSHSKMATDHHDAAVEKREKQFLSNFDESSENQKHASWKTSS